MGKNTSCAVAIRFQVSIQCVDANDVANVADVVAAVIVVVAAVALLSFRRCCSC